MKKDAFLISEKRPIAEDRYKRKIPVRVQKRLLLFAIALRNYQLKN
ncbi:hypothetical protein ACFFH4_22610 [Halalkalibacter alkalisediminis]|jgi:hypothetical protein|uniref:Uncharacterized protein n=1 Tax=Halalkalibacter alkalisediminis TaxID=935616 RepID=A0ABV6NML4_9BACI